MENQGDQNQTQTPPKTLQQAYQKALLQSGIQAAKLLNALIELKLIPDPRAKEMADLALEVIKIIHSAPEEIVNFTGLTQCCLFHLGARPERQNRLRQHGTFLSFAQPCCT